MNVGKELRSVNVFEKDMFGAKNKCHVCHLV